MDEDEPRPDEREEPDEPVEVTPALPPPNFGTPIPPFVTPDVGDEESA